MPWKNTEIAEKGAGKHKEGRRRKVGAVEETWRQRTGVRTQGQTGDLECYFPGMKVLLLSEDTIRSPDLFDPEDDHHHLRFKVQAPMLTES